MSAQLTYTSGQVDKSQVWISSTYHCPVKCLKFPKSWTAGGTDTALTRRIFCAVLCFDHCILDCIIFACRLLVKGINATQEWNHPQIVGNLPLHFVRSTSTSMLTAVFLQIVQIYWCFCMVISWHKTVINGWPRKATYK